MKRLIIVCEGQTEQAFCRDVLERYFSSKEILLQYPTIKASKGGIVAWEVLKKQIEIHLKQDTSAMITLLIDYYGIGAKHSFPEWAKCAKISDKLQRMDALEKAMWNDVDASLQSRFIPYIQLHEFEGLLFSDKGIFDNSFEKHEFDDYNYLLDTLKDFPNPEDINDGNETAPSKRLQRIIKGYRSERENLKVFYGSLLSHDIGLDKIMSKCPRFAEWITVLIS